MPQRWEALLQVVLWLSLLCIVGAMGVVGYWELEPTPQFWDDIGHPYGVDVGGNRTLAFEAGTLLHVRRDQCVRRPLQGYIRRELFNEQTKEVIQLAITATESQFEMGCRTTSFSFTLPSDLASGPWQYRATVDVAINPLRRQQFPLSPFVFTVTPSKWVRTAMEHAELYQRLADLEVQVKGVKLVLRQAVTKGAKP